MIKINKIWKDIDGYEGLYKISNYGEVFSYKKNDILKPEVMKKGGYLRVGLSKNGKRERIMIHRLVMYTFVEYKPYPQWEVNHKDMNVSNNYILNLEWVTLQENMNHSFKNNPNKINNLKKSFSKIGKKYNKIGIEMSKKKIARCDFITSEILEVYESAREASKQGYNYKSISLVCNNKRKSHAGFVWKFI